MRSKSILVVAAHPDDEVLGCGGTIARRVEEGHDVYIAVLGEGITSRYEDRDDADQALVESLASTSREVGEFLGAEKVYLDEFPDNRFDTVPLLKVIKSIEDLIDTVHPEVVYTQHGGDLNIDHNVVYRATLTATRPMIECPVREVYAYEVASSTEWAFQEFSPPFRPNTFVEIEDTLDRKVEAMQMYETEARSYPHPRSPKSLRAIARNWGRTAGMQAAEAFELVRSVER
ncbi:PIG-L deacetylase family protein [Salinibacter ruber]|uniref:LmbE family N-acetylglucosaminyl deacetylase n=1 Tax=Salinibacter ruber TaxID=146919 RepID=A0A9X2Q7N1_9BACT|nr:PIG-L family deacetylase [Salinibacter ruber]MCS3710961.1 LmbE family N-acetylglucosaminyl deacetylase [Salinibacter ruber]